MTEEMDLQLQVPVPPPYCPFPATIISAGLPPIEPEVVQINNFYPSVPSTSGYIPELDDPRSRPLINEQQQLDWSLDAPVPPDFS